jgi:hypothetical protein
MGSRPLISEGRIPPGVFKTASPSWTRLELLWLASAEEMVVRAPRPVAGASLRGLILEQLEELLNRKAGVSNNGAQERFLDGSARRTGITVRT